jgi:hypothetical protein
MFFQDITPDTSGYMIAGFVISFVVMGLYVASMYLRTRSLRQDQSLLEEMDREAKPAAEPKRPASPGPLGEKKYTPVTKKSTQK